MELKSQAARAYAEVDEIGDVTLLRQFIATGSQDSFAELARRHSHMVYATCLRVIGDSHHAEDCAQAVFLKLSQSAQSVVERENIAGWLYLTAQNMACNSRRGRARAIKREAQSALKENDAPESNWDDLRPKLDAAVASLPPDQRDAIVMCYLNGLTHARIARELGCSKNTVSSRVQLGLAKLREKLRAETVSLSIATLTLLLESHARTSAPESLVLKLTKAPLKPPPAKLLATHKSAAALILAVIGAGLVLTFGLPHATVQPRVVLPPLGASAVSTKAVASGETDAFLLKLQPTGDVAWLRTFGGTSADTVTGLAVDEYQNVAVVGSAYQNFAVADKKFDGQGSYDLYVATFDAAGQFKWAQALGGPEADLATDVVFGHDGKLYVSGSFADRVVLPTAPPIAPIEWGAKGGGTYGCVICFGADGAISWGRLLPGGAPAAVRHLVIDPAGDVLGLGAFVSGSMAVKSEQATERLTSPLFSQFYGFELTAGGDVKVAKTFGSAPGSNLYHACTLGPGKVTCVGEVSNEKDPKIRIPTLFSEIDLTTGRSDAFPLTAPDTDLLILGLAVDAAGNRVLCGSISGECELKSKGRNERLNVGDKRRMLLAKFDPDGKLLWVKHWGGNGRSMAMANDVAVDSKNNLCVTGFFQGTLSLGSNDPRGVLASQGGNDAFVAKFSPDGILQWATVVGGSGHDSGSKITIANDDTIYCGGQFQNEISVFPRAATE